MNFVIHPFIKYSYRRITSYGAWGLFLFVLACGLVAYKSLVSDAKVFHVEHQLAALQRNIKENKPAQIENIDINRVDKFLSESDLPGILELIQIMAGKNHVSFDSIEYAFNRVPELNVISCTINLPVSGKYLDIQKFIYQILDHYAANMVLNNIEVYRENNTVNELNGNLQLIVYLKS
jgi:hypothetical protein